MAMIEPLVEQEARKLAYKTAHIMNIWRDRKDEVDSFDRIEVEIVRSDRRIKVTVEVMDE